MAEQGLNAEVGNILLTVNPVKMRSVYGEIDLDIPRDRSGSFELKLIKKGEEQLNCLDDRTFAFYTRGLTTCVIQAHFEEFHGLEVSLTFIT